MNYAYLIGTDIIGAQDPRTTAVAYLAGLQGTPYIWAGKSPQTGLDCSGAVLAAWEHAGIVPVGTRKSLNSQALWDRTKHVSEAEALPGDLAFYGPGKVNHVMMVVGDGRVIGASGGGPETTTPEKAKATVDRDGLSAGVKYKLLGYRKDFLGIGRAPVGEALSAPSRSWIWWVVGAVGAVGLGVVGAVLARKRPVVVG